MQHKFSEAWARGLGPQPGQKHNLEIVSVTDPGFGLRLTPKGHKSFFYRYKTREGKRRFINLGTYPGTSLKQARAEYLKQRAIRHDAVSRADPKERIRAQEAAAAAAQHRAEYTVNRMAEEFLARRCRELAPATVTSYRSILRANILPALGAMPAPDVTRADVAEACSRVADRGSRGAAATTRRLCRMLFKWAFEMGRIGHNPAAGVPRIGRINVGSRVLSADELKRFLREAPQVLHPESAAILELQLLTGCRIGEIASLRSAEVNRETREFTIPATRIKTRQELWVPLSDRALALLPERRGRLWPTNADKRTRTRLLTALKRDWDLPRFVAHDMRRTARTVLAELGCPMEVGELILGHKLQGIVGVYNKSEHRAARREWLERLAAYYDGLRAGKVVRLRAG